VQRLEDRPAGHDDGVGAGDQLHHARRVVACDRRQPVLGVGGARVRRRDHRAVIAQALGEGAEQRLVTWVALAERAGEEHASAGHHAVLVDRSRCDCGHAALP
jgi:hypothetical protein